MNLDYTHWDILESSKDIMKGEREGEREKEGPPTGFEDPRGSLCDVII